MSKRRFIQLTDAQKRLHTSIENLKLYMENAALSSAEMAQHIDMTRKQKEKLVTAIYFKDKKRKDFYTCTDGRIKSYNPQFIATSREQLIDKLY